MSGARVCLDCGAIFHGTAPRCPEHQQATVSRRSREYEARVQRPSPSRRGYGRDWRAARAEAIKAQPSCSECGATENLTVASLPPLGSAGAGEKEQLRTLCLSCNRRRRNGG